MPLIHVSSNSRGLTNKGHELFKQAYNSLVLTRGPEPVVIFGQQERVVFQEIARLRQRAWKTTSAWNALADETGLFGELAFHKDEGTPAERVISDFESGLHGDGGTDRVTPVGKTVDRKATRGQALRFKFNQRNAFSNVAQIISFAHVLERGDEVHVRLLGWSWKADVNLYIRHDERYDFVNFETLRREGLVYPVATLINQ